MRTLPYTCKPIQAFMAAAGRAGSRMQSHPNSGHVLSSSLFSNQEQQPASHPFCELISVMHAIPNGFGLILKLVFAIHQVQQGKSMKTHKAQRPLMKFRNESKGVIICSLSSCAMWKWHVFPMAFRYYKDTATQGWGLAARSNLLGHHTTQAP